MGKKENEIGGNDAVCTPASVFEPVLQAMGLERFDLDPCSHPDAVVPVRKRVLLPAYEQWEYTLSAALDDWPGRENEERIYADGLTLDWSGQDVWKNPPYSQLRHTVPTKKYPGGKYPWFHKLAYEAARGVAFVPSRTSSRWWHHWVLNCPRADILVQLKGRVRHHGEKWGSPFHQVLVAYNVTPEALDAWREAFDHPHGGFVTDLRRMR